MVKISFNNVNDLYGAVALVREFGNQIITAAIKHSTPCGVAITGNTGYDSYVKAYSRSSIDFWESLLTIKLIKQQLIKCIDFLRNRS